MGTSAVEEPDMLKDFCVKYPNRLVLGIDALDGVVKTQGWLKGSWNLSCRVSQKI